MRSSHTHGVTARRFSSEKMARLLAVVMMRLSETVITEQTPDGHPQLWLLYRPESFEPFSVEDRQIPLWVRQVEVFTSLDKAQSFLDELCGITVDWQPYNPIFPELLIGRHGRSRWLIAPAPLNPPGGKR